MKFYLSSHIIYFSSLVAFSAPVAGRQYHCAPACQLALSHVVFSDTDATLSYYPLQCGSQLRVASVYACIKYYCGALILSDGRKQLNGPCERYANITLPPVSIIDGLSDAELENLPRFSHAQYDDGLQVNRTQLPDHNLFELALRSKDAWSDSVRTRTQYGNVMFYFWLAVIVVGLIGRWPLVFSRSSRDGVDSYTVNQLRRWLLVPATFSKHCAEPYGWCTIPPRLQSSILFAFTILNVVLCCVNYEVFEGNLNWPTPVQWTRYIADRTGVISIANLPLIWLFATRNNILILVTGWSFETAMQFHRWVARISTIEAVIHSLAYTVQVFQTGDWQEYVAYWHMRYWGMGGLATAAMSLVCVFSVYPMRHHFYELFLIIHVSLGILTLLGMLYHVEIFDGAYNWYIWPCFLIWLLDRVGRICRLAYVNYRTSPSTIEYSPESNAVWLSVPISSDIQPRPGEYYFLYLFKDHSFYESHPFTISSWDKTSLSFLIRPYNGFTGRLAQIGQLAYNTTGKSSTSCKVRVLAEGPYGSTSDLRQYDSLIFVVGGTGIAVVIAYLTDLRERTLSRKSQYYEARYIKIIWAVQHEAFFRQVWDRDIEPSLQQIWNHPKTNSLRIEMEIFITRGSIAPQSSTQAVQRRLSLSDSARRLSKEVMTPHELSIITAAVQENEREEIASERSSLLSSRSPSLVEDFSSTSKTPLNAIQHRQSDRRSPTIPGNTTLTTHQTRPNIPALLSEACSSDSTYDHLHNDTDSLDPVSGLMSSDRKDTSRAAVICCGPPSLADAARSAVVSALSSKPYSRIDFINESYSW